MRRLNLVLLATFQLCRARSPSFSIHEDLLAFPQFEVVFSENFISETEAQALLESKDPHPTYSADFSQPTTGEVGEAGVDAGAEEDEHVLEHVYEIVNMSPHRYLCSIPVIQPPGPENQTANELARAEEARQLSQAAENGWGLLNDLGEMCLYFMSGWWSYKFCNNREIVQFHAISGPPPKPDPHSAEYVLGREPAIPASAQQLANRSPEDDEPIPAELVVKGDQRYLVQKLVGGTICDLTGRERTIEVQYHCDPSKKQDRIGWIKEVTICSYVMVVNTPRLCSDVAFLPPKVKKANPISCQLILEGDEPERLLLEQNAQDANAMAKAQLQQEVEAVLKGQKPVIVGGVAVGQRKVLSAGDEAGKPPVKLEPPRSYQTTGKSATERLIEMVAKAASKDEGGKFEVLSAEDLERLDLDPEDIEEMRKQMEKIAGDAGWKVEVFELAGNQRELRGSLNGGEESEEGSVDAKKGNKKSGEAKKGAKEAKEAKKEEVDGSEEKFFKEEL